jgi:hypothetical protein
MGRESRPRGHGTEYAKAGDAAAVGALRRSILAEMAIVAGILALAAAWRSTPLPLAAEQRGAAITSTSPQDPALHRRYRMAHRRARRTSALRHSWRRREQSAKPSTLGPVGPGRPSIATAPVTTGRIASCLWRETCTMALFEWPRTAGPKPVAEVSHGPCVMLASVPRRIPARTGHIRHGLFTSGAILGACASTTRRSDSCFRHEENLLFLGA